MSSCEYQLLFLVICIGIGRPKGWALVYFSILYMKRGWDVPQGREMQGPQNHLICYTSLLVRDSLLNYLYKQFEKMLSAWFTNPVWVFGERRLKKRMPKSSSKPCPLPTATPLLTAPALSWQRDRWQLWQGNALTGKSRTAKLFSIRFSLICFPSPYALPANTPRPSPHRHCFLVAFILNMVFS